jgi:hypothetical protein
VIELLAFASSAHDNAAVKADNSKLKAEVAQMPGLRTENATLKSQIPGLETEIANLNAEIARMKSVSAPAPVQRAGAPSPVLAQQAVGPGTLLAENAKAVEALPIKLKTAELLLAKGAGPWDIGEFKAKVVGRAPLLVIVEFLDSTDHWGETHAGDVCGGFAAVPFEDKMYKYVADPTGASFVFSLRPTAARYPLKDEASAVILGSGGGGCFWFGYCLEICSDGDMYRNEETYAVPSGWKTGSFVKFTRFEVWRVTA